GRPGVSACWGLPAIPVSPLWAGAVFPVPLLRRLWGAPPHDAHPPGARLAVALDPNGSRQHYMRATTAPGSDGLCVVTPVRSQDSSLLAPLAQADCLLIRAPHAPLAPLGALVPILPLDF